MASGKVMASVSSGAVERVTPVHTRPPLSNVGSGSWFAGAASLGGDVPGVPLDVPGVSPLLVPPPGSLLDEQATAPATPPRTTRAPPTIQVRRRMPGAWRHPPLAATASVLTRGGG